MKKMKKVTLEGMSVWAIQAGAENEEQRENIKKLLISIVRVIPQEVFEIIGDEIISDLVRAAFNDFVGSIQKWSVRFMNKIITSAREQNCATGSYMMHTNFAPLKKGCVFSLELLSCAEEEQDNFDNDPHTVTPREFAAHEAVGIEELIEAELDSAFTNPDMLQRLAEDGGYYSVRKTDTSFVFSMFVPEVTAVGICNVWMQNKVHESIKMMSKEKRDEGSNNE